MARKYSNKKIILLLILIALIAGGLIYYFYTSGKKTYVPNHVPSNIPAKGAQGGAVDNHGQTTTPPASESRWTVSASGVITVQQPVSNALFVTGDTIEGLAQVNSVDYRLIDNDVGLLAEGSLSVVNGKFSGTLDFASKAASGQLDIFSTESNGKEINEVNIPLKFNN